MIKLITESTKIKENKYSQVTSEFINGLNPELKDKPEKLIKLAKKLNSITSDPKAKNEYKIIIDELTKSLEECVITEDISLEQLQDMIGKELYDLLSIINPVDQIYLDTGSTDFSGRVQDVPWTFSKSKIQNVSYDGNKKLYNVIVKM